MPRGSIGKRRHGRVRGPLHGIPLVVKDNMDTRGPRLQSGDNNGLDLD